MKYLRWMLLMLVMVWGVAVLFHTADSSREVVWETSTYNPGGSGHKALYLVLQDQGWPVDRWRRGYGELLAADSGRDGEDHRVGDSRRQAMVMARGLLGRYVPLGLREIDAVLQWVAAGNDLVLFGPYHLFEDTDTLVSRLGFRLRRPAQPGTLFLEQAAEMQRSIRQLDSLRQPAGERGEVIIDRVEPLPPPPPKTGEVLWEHDGKPYIARMPYGKGMVTWCASTSLIDNQTVLRADNLAVALGLLQRDGQLAYARIWFDETQHGYRESYPTSELLNVPGMVLFGLILAVGIVLFLATGLRRFGPPIEDNQEPLLGSRDLVRSLGLLYQRAGLSGPTLAYLRDETRADLLHRLNLPTTASDERLAHRLREKYPDAPDWLKLSRDMEAPDQLAPSAVVRLAQRLVDLRRQVVG